MGNDRTYSLDTLPQEYSGSGAGDFRLSSLELELPDGSYVADLRYVDAKLQSGKYTLEGLPASLAPTKMRTRWLSRWRTRPPMSG